MERLKRALVITASYDYLPGLHAFLNAFEYYQNKGIDVYVLYTRGLSESYVNYVKDKFSYSITPICVEEWGDPTICLSDNCIWAKYHFITTLKGYSAICHIDADCLLLGNLESTFDIVDNTENIACPFNIRSAYPFESYPTLDIETYCISQVLYNYPIFFNPNKHMDIMHYMWDNRDAINCSNDPIMFNRSLFVLDKHKYVIPLDNGIWCGETIFHYSSMKLEFDKELKVINPDGNRIIIWHSRFWINSMNVHALKEAKNYKESYEFAKQNIDVGCAAIDYYSNKCTVKKQEFLSKHPECEYFFTR